MCVNRETPLEYCVIYHYSSVEAVKGKGDGEGNGHHDNGPTAE